MAAIKKVTLNTVLSTMERGFAAVASDIADIKATMATKTELAAVRREMATKDDVRAIVQSELSPIRSELKSIRHDLDDLTQKVENVIGFRQEIDHALERIAAIEDHLGIQKKIAG